MIVINEGYNNSGIDLNPIQKNDIIMPVLSA